jgi:hypothetical protein
MGLRHLGQRMARSRTRLYKLDLRAELPAIGKDKLSAARAASLHAATRSNLAYGYVARRV